MSEDRLTRDDLVLLMESYRNMIIMHQTILDQSSKTIERMDNIADKQDSLFSKQGQIFSSLEKITDNLDNIASHTSTCSDEIKNMGIDINGKMNEHEKNSITQYGQVVNKIYLGWIGMGTIIISIIGLLFKSGAI